MKQFQLRVIAVAAALVAAAPTSAAILDSNATVTGGELFLSVYDSTRQISYTRDLGITLTGFNPAGSLNFANDPLLLSAFTGNLSGASYQVLAEKGGFNYAYLTTTLADLATVSTSTTSQVSQFKAGADPYLAAVNLEGTHPTLADGSSFTTDPNDAANVGKILQTNWGGKTPVFDTSAPVGTELNFYKLSKPASGPLASVIEFDNKWKLGADGTLTYSAASVPVPEPASWVLLAAGLIAVGGIARSRTRS